MNRPPHVHLTITVDRTQCQGTGLCAQLAGHIFKLGPDGIAVATAAAAIPEDLELIYEAEQNCPTDAISVRVSPHGAVDE